MKNKFSGLLLISVLLSACTNNGMEATLEDAKEIAIDESGNQEEIINVEVVENENGYKVEYDTSTGHYIFLIDKYGMVEDKEYKPLKDDVTKDNADEGKKESKTEDNAKSSEKEGTSLTESQKKAKQSALMNAGISESDCEEITVKNEADGTIVVTLKIKEVGTMITQADKNGDLITSWFQ